MKKTKKLTVSTISLILLLTISSIIVIMPTAIAHDPAWELVTHAFISASPNPTGVNQPVLVVVWMERVINSASITNDIRFEDYTLTITKPDASTETVEWPIVLDTTSSAYTLYTPDQIGTYTLVFDFPGQVYDFGGSYQNDTYLPSTATTTLIVQEETVGGIPDAPLPTDYWTRPIDGQNHLWDSIASNWLGGAAIGDRWQKDGSAPTSAHVMWTKPIELGGLVGDSTNPGLTYYSGFSYETRFGDPMIVGGILIYVNALNHASRAGGITAVDLRTGEELWSRNDLRPTKAQLYDFQSPNQHGVVGGTLWATSGSTWIGIDAFTGLNVFNLTNVPSGTEVYTEKGEIVRYVLDSDGWLALWNNTAAAGVTGSGYNVMSWRPIGKEIDASEAYSWNVTIPDLPGSSSPRIVGVIPGDLVLGRSSSITLTSQARDNPDDPWTMWAISDRPGSRGELLWIRDYPAPEGNLTRMLSMQPIDPVNRVWTMTDFQTGERTGYSLDTGDLLWGPLGEQNAFQYYSNRAGFPAYGNLYVGGYGGQVLSYSTIDGTLQWTYDARNLGTETPWGLSPIQISAIADGIVYAFAGEHSPNTPLYKGYRVYAIDAFTGEELWTLPAWSASGLGTSLAPIAIADGYLVYMNAYDGQIYCIGKGPSATTVSAPMTAITQGSSVMITGSVTDQSVGAKDTPAMSDEDMSVWMEYIHQQKPLPVDATGVTVKLTAIDPNGNLQNIGNVTTDIAGNFGMSWVPPVECDYFIKAEFVGSESYGNSYATTYMVVDPAPTPATTIEPEEPETPTEPEEPETPTEPEQPAEAPLITTEIAILAAVAVACVVGVAAFWALKKRK